MELKQQIHFQGQISALPFRSKKIKVKWKKRRGEYGQGSSDLSSMLNILYVIYHDIIL